MACSLLAHKMHFTIIIHLKHQAMMPRWHPVGAGMSAAASCTHRMMIIKHNPHNHKAITTNPVYQTTPLHTLAASKRTKHAHIQLKPATQHAVQFEPTIGYTLSSSIVRLGGSLMPTTRPGWAASRQLAQLSPGKASQTCGT